MPAAGAASNSLWPESFASESRLKLLSRCVDAAGSQRVQLLSLSVPQQVVSPEQASAVLTAQQEAAQVLDMARVQAASLEASLQVTALFHVVELLCLHRTLRRLKL